MSYEGFDQNIFSFYLRTHFEESWSKSDSIFQNRAFERDGSPLHAPNGDKQYLSSLLRNKKIGGIPLSFYNEVSKPKRSQTWGKVQFHCSSMLQERQLEGETF